jgi:Tfp pilus assembly protein PilX
VPPALLKTSSASAAPRTRTGGFALLITITLLSFVVLLLVGLATYTRIETAISGNTQKQAQARQNALLALDVALGQLQKHAGPDQRVTATAESFGGGTGSNRYTGVWDTTTAGTTPITWLVSGNETNVLAIKPTTTLTATNAAELVGLKTSALANDVRAPLVPITTVGVPGQATAATIGRYAWWVGDQGVKAPVAVPDKSGAVTYSPWTDSERIRQQIYLGAPASDTAAATVFDAQSSTNTNLVSSLPTTNQLTFFNKSSTNSFSNNHFTGRKISRFNIFNFSNSLFRWSWICFA